jgi:hypothetical protein
VKIVDKLAKVYTRKGEEELIRSNNPFAMIALIARSVFAGKNLTSAAERDAALMKTKLKLSRKFLSMALAQTKIRRVMNFLKNYMRFENSENNITFERELEQITGRTRNMGVEELILTMERKRGEKRGIELGEKQGIEHNRKEVVSNMIRKDFSDELISEIVCVSVDYVRKLRVSFSKNEKE